MRPRHIESLSDAERIGAYEIVRLLAHGEVASVYACQHATLDRLAAVKVLHPHLARDKETAARFVREGRALSRIVHPNVVEVFDVGEREGVPYLVMSLVDGDDLEEHIRLNRPMPIVDVVETILPVVGAVAAAYDAGVVQRELKPKSVRLSPDHRGALVPKVLDFGISKLTGDERGQKYTMAGDMLEMLGYMSPEQLRANRQPNLRGDVYSLGVLLYQCATGRRPFVGGTIHELTRCVLNEDPAPPSHVRRDILPAFDAVVLRAMHREPSERYVSARELGRALAPFASDPSLWVAEFAPRSGHRMIAGKSARVDDSKRSAR
jgi:eukaryotic-like serine/threonine-protein kinase